MPLIDGLHRDSYRDPRFHLEDMVILRFFLVFSAAARGFDYATGVEQEMPPTPVLAVVEKAFPLSVWASAFLAGALVLTFGALTTRHLMVWLGHNILQWAYLILALGLIIPTLNEPWFDGNRTGTTLLALASLHWLIARRLGPVPITDHDIAVLGATVRRVGSG